jgi:hypothetical protein
MLYELETGFQLNQTHRRGLDPGDCNLDQDICDISLWLAEKFHYHEVELWIDRHHFQREYEVASFTVMVWQDHQDQISVAALEAFVALGYQIIDTGAVVYSHQCSEGTNSRHAALRAYARIEEALRLSLKDRK